VETAPGRCDLPMSEPAPLDPAAIQFNELCLWLERAYPPPGGLGATGAPRRERVRFRANPTLAFPAEEVAAVALPAGPGEPVIVTANLFGLHGPSSPLPPAVTERIVHAQEDGALRAFLDFFNHRLLALLFRIWKHYRHQHRYRAGGTDPITDAVAALFGKVGREGGDGTPSRTLLLPYTGLLALPPRSASSARYPAISRPGTCRCSSIAVTTIQSAKPRLSFHTSFCNARCDSTKDSALVRTKRRSSTFGWACRMSREPSVEPSS